MAIGAMRIGQRADLKLVRVEEYYLSDVLMGVDEDPAVVAGEHVFADTPCDEYDTVHAEVLDAEPVYEDDPGACDVADWIDAPSAPSEDTYWDDARHFEGVQD